MAVIIPTEIDVSPKQDGSAWRVVWTPVTESDTCRPVSYPKHSDKSIQVYIAPAGAFGGCSVALNGSNDNLLAGGGTYAPLNDPSSTVIAITTAKIKAVLENTVYVQPAATGGTAQSITIAMLFHFSNPARQ